MQHVRLNNFRPSGSILTRLFSVDAPRGRGDKLGTFFYNACPQNLWQPKIAQHFSRFLTTFDFDREYLRNESTYQKPETLLIIYNPSALRGCFAMKFLHALQIDQGYLSHTPTGTGVTPKKILIVKIKNLA